MPDANTDADADPAPPYTYLDSSAASWSNYLAHRPAYPKSMEDLIMAYHRAHSNSLRLAHDIGAGPAVFTPRLAAYFQHIHVSDPSGPTLALARDRLSAFHATHWAGARFSFSRGGAEEAQRSLARASVDCCVALMSAHWAAASADAVVAAVAESLAPNGTLAMVQYNPACEVVGPRGGALGSAVRGVFGRWGRRFVEVAGEERAGRVCSPLDWVGLRDEMGDEVWIQDVTKRIKINSRGRGDAAFVVPGLEDLVLPEKRVGGLQRKFWFENEDKEGEGWRREVDLEWLKGYVASMEKVENMHLYDEDFARVGEAIKETTKDGKFVVEWAAAILLATKK